MVIDLTTGKITCASAGHPAPLLLRAETRTAEMMNPEEGKQGPALGIFDSTVYEETTCQMKPNDGIVLYTDGIFEAENKTSCECYETERVQQNLQENIAMPPKEILDSLLKNVREFCDSESFDDDVCLIGIKLKKLMTE
jgi:serine phosphatase RsbU (regulator of sigma subunit)